MNPCSARCPRETYLPEAVLTQTLDGRWRPALCYVAPQMEPRPAATDYLDRIIEPANAFGFPRWYIERLQGFRVPDTAL